MHPIARATAALTLVAALAAAGCQRAPAPVIEPTPTEPTLAVDQLIRDLRHNDLVAWSRHAVPPELHARLGGPQGDFQLVLHGVALLDLRQALRCTK